MRLDMALLASLVSLALGSAAVPARAAPADPYAAILGVWNTSESAPMRPPFLSLEIGRTGNGDVRVMVQPLAGAPELAQAVTWDGSRLAFSLPGGWVGRRIHLDWNGRWFHWSDVRDRHGRGPAIARAPRLATPEPRGWKPSRALFDALSLTGWAHRPGYGDDAWTVRDGALVHTTDVRGDLVSLQHFRNFRLSLEFRLQPLADTGVHLRGRYEIQLTTLPPEDSSEKRSGSIYGRLAPIDAVRVLPGRWHRLDVTLLGRRLWAAIDGETIHDGALVPGVTGDALDAAESAPGPIMLQGLTGECAFRNIVLTPAR